MTVEIREFAAGDGAAVVALSLRAWEPVFASFESVLGSRIYRRLYPDWRDGQARAVAAECAEARTWVAVDGDEPVGFVAVVLHDDPYRGEIEMLAVDPDAQHRGTGTALTEYATECIRRSGATLAEIATGGDPGHAPARRTYERACFTPLPLVRYYRAL